MKFEILCHVEQFVLSLQLYLKSRDSCIGVLYVFFSILTTGSILPPWQFQFSFFARPLYYAVLFHSTTFRNDLEGRSMDWSDVGIPIPCPRTQRLRTPMIQLPRLARRVLVHTCTPSRYRRTAKRRRKRLRRRMFKHRRILSSSSSSSEEGDREH